MSQHQHIHGIVLRKKTYFDSSELITILTAEHGKILSVAKNSQSSKSPFCGRLEPGYEVRGVLFEGRQTYHLNEVDIVSPLAAQTSSLPAQSAQFYLFEFLDRLLPENDACPALFSLLRETLGLTAKETNKLPILITAFIFKFLTIQGFMASWKTCSKSNLALSEHDSLYLHHADASVVLQHHADYEDTPLPFPVVKWVNYLQHYPITDTLRVIPSELEQRYTWSVIHLILERLLSKPLHSEAFLVESLRSF